ncbi:hypothetical protein [Paenarthrobacter sp. YIM B13468]|uniref:hypothetical protein n=1 Tax=Paenarthrobacter sp. YIM B13468 TaxID=3366295 RepID=UPI00366D4CAC
MKDQRAHLKIESRSLQLRGRWRQRSEQAGWLFPGDWLVPEVEDMLKAQAEGGELQMSAKNLGASRAYHGVGVRETMQDLSAFFEAAGVPADDGSMRDLVEGWAQENERVEPFSCTDVYTGLATMAHFERLIHEMSLRPSARRRSHTIASLHLGWSDGGKLLGWEMLAEMGQICRGQLAAVEATGAYHRGSIHTMLTRKRESYEALFRCLQLIDGLHQGVGRRTLVEFLDFPTSPAECDRVISGLRFSQHD